MITMAKRGKGPAGYQRKTDKMASLSREMGQLAIMVR